MSTDYNRRVSQVISGARGRGRWKRVACPICVIRKGTDDPHAALGYDSQSGRWHCFR